MAPRRRRDVRGARARRAATTPQRLLRRAASRRQHGQHRRHPEARPPQISSTGQVPLSRTKPPRGAATCSAVPGRSVQSEAAAGHAVDSTFDADPVGAGAGRLRTASSCAPGRAARRPGPERSDTGSPRGWERGTVGGGQVDRRHDRALRMILVTQGAEPSPGRGRRAGAGSVPRDGAVALPVPRWPQAGRGRSRQGGV